MSEFARDHVDEIQERWRSLRPDLDPSPIGVIGRMHRIALALTPQITRVYDEFGLSESEFDLLATLRRIDLGEGVTAGDLAARTMVTTGGLTKRIDRLEQRGLVERAPGATDGRVRLIRLTAGGVELIDEAFTAHLANEAQIVAQLGDDAAVLEPILRRWAIALGE